jgi:hypothetical protein
MRELIAELDQILERIREPGHGSHREALVAAVREGTREAIGAWLLERSKQWDTIRPYTNAARWSSARSLRINAPRRRPAW